jgi:hypothetical protein
MTNEPGLPESDPLEAALSQVLAKALRPPAEPAELRARVLAAVARERIPDWQRARRDVEIEYRGSIAALNARYLRRCRDALLAGLGVVLLIGLGIQPLVRALHGLFEASAPLVVGLLALGLGVVYGAVLLREIFGPGAIGITSAPRSGP